MPGRPNGKRSATCGAKNRQGQPCKARLLLKGGKCRHHGGMSTGAKTLEGLVKAYLRIAAKQKKTPEEKLAWATQKATAAFAKKSAT